MPMGADLQKASMWKRISAWLFDTILLACVAVIFGLVLSFALNFDSQCDKLGEYYARYETQYGIDFDITEEAYAKMDAQQQAAYQETYNIAYDALIADDAAMKQYSLVVNLVMLITSFGLLFAYLLMELLIPIWLKNGQTLGKKIFSIGVARIDSVKISGVQLFIRTVLGKYAVGTMVPVYVLILLFTGGMGILGIAVLAGLVIAQGICLIAGGEGRAIQDRLAGTVVVDIASQRIFKSSEDLAAYTERVQAEQLQDRSY